MAGGEVDLVAVVWPHNVTEKNVILGTEQKKNVAGDRQ